ncbi:MAG TPA: hypothetical protein VHL80_05310, partial [Polyangia bacterium]|nr:hypothetical protein [Polyangia bacterium]
MAGKTLTGIGEDESGRHELGADTSDPAIGKPGDKTPSVRPTDKMPMYAGPSATPTIRAGTLPALGPGAALVDEDKVAEGLKKLRSLDEPLGPIPTSPAPTTLRDGVPGFNFPSPGSAASMPTLKEGMAVVGLPTPVNPSSLAAAAQSELIRARGTAHGHALSAAAGAPSAMPVSIDDRLKGTLLGHDLHLPDLPAIPEEEQRQAEVRAVAPTSVAGTPARAIATEPMPTAFSKGDSRFFDSQPVNDELEPEPRSNKLLVRATIAFAAAAVIAVVIVAWTHHKPDPAAAETQAVVPTPTAENPSVPPPVVPPPVVPPPVDPTPVDPPPVDPAATIVHERVAGVV